MKGRPPDRSSRRGGLLAKLLLFLVLLGAVAAVLWVLLLPTYVVSTIKSRTGFGIKVDSLAINPLTARVAIKGMVIENPEGWPATEFVHLREFRSDVSLLSLLGDQPEAEEVIIDLAQLTLVRNRQGALNAMTFKDGLSGKPRQADTGRAGPAQKFLIRHLVLKFDRLVYVDDTGARPVTKVYELNVNRDMRDVDSVAKIISPFTGAALGLFSGALHGLFPDRPDLAQELTGILQGAGKKTGEKLKGLLETLDKKRP